MKKEKKIKERDIYVIAIILLFILLSITMYHAYNMESNCMNVCQEKIKPYEDMIKGQTPTNQWNINADKCCKGLFCTDTYYDQEQDLCILTLTGETYKPNGGLI